MKGELLGRGADCGLDDVATDAHPLARDDRAGIGQDLPRLRIENVHADVFEEIERGAMDGLDLIVRQEPHGREAAARLLPWQLGERCTVASAAWPSPATFARQSHHQLRLSMARQ